MDNTWNVVPPSEWLETEEQVINASIYLMSTAFQTGLAVDTENTGLNNARDYPLMVSLSDGYRRFAMMADWAHHPAIKRDLLENPHIFKVGTKLKYDKHMLANIGINLAGDLRDTLVMDWLHDENRGESGRHGLKETAKDYLNLRMREFKDVFKLRKATKTQPAETAGEAIRRTMADPVARIEAIDYSGLDAYASMKVHNYLRDRLMVVEMYPGQTLWSYFLNKEVPYTTVLWNMERRGFPICTGYLRAQKTPILKTIKECNDAITQRVGHPVNLNSPPQLQNLFFDRLQCSSIKKTKGGKTGVIKDSTDGDVLAEFARNGSGPWPDIVKDLSKLILKHRKVAKVLGTYIEGILESVDNELRIHTTFNQHGTVTGRLSSSDPNCFDGLTEVLTEAGWVYLTALKFFPPGTKVAQWDNGAITFVNPTGYVESIQPVVHLENDHIDLAVTKDHRCLLQHRKTNELRVFNAENYPEDWRQLHAGLYAGGSLHLEPEEVVLLCATQADGHYHDGGIDFGFKKARKAVRLLEALQKLKIPFSHNPNQKGRVRIRVFSGAPVENIKRLLPNKGFGPSLLKFDRETLDTFCEEVWHWDGCLTRKNHFSSNGLANADWVQIALVLSDKRANVRTYQGAKNLNYQVDVTHRNYSLTTNIKRSEAGTPVPVFCVSVPSSYLLVRRNGKVCVTGNCQNIPRPKGDDFKIRNAFVASAGKRLVVMDYDQLEMKLMAHFSQDPKMIGAIADGLDLHCYTVSLMYGKNYDEVYAAKNLPKGQKPTPEQEHLLGLRQAAKNTGFGLIYGIGPKKLGEDLSDELGYEITFEAAKELIRTYFKVFPGVKEFIEYTHKYCKQTQYVQTLLGRYRRLPNINAGKWASRHDEDDDAKKAKGIAAQAQRQAVNSIIQGTAADIASGAMMRAEYDHELNQLGAQLLMQIHDELVWEVDDNEEVVKLVTKRAKSIMEEPFPGFSLRVPLTVGGSSGYSWLEAK